MAPRSCMMNPAPGSPTATTPGETLPGERCTKMGKDALNKRLDLSPVRRCMDKSLNLPFSVESLMSDKRTPTRTHFSSPEAGSGGQSDGSGSPTSPRDVYAQTRLQRSGAEELSDCTKREAAELSDREQSPWFQTSYASPPSEFAVTLSRFAVVIASVQFSSVSRILLLTEVKLLLGLSIDVLYLYPAVGLSKHYCIIILINYN